jgi:addiction module HigA family antidote
VDVAPGSSPPEPAPRHPGLELREQLERLAISQAELAEYIGILPSKLSMVIHGTRGITPELAWLLSMALGTSPMFWMKRQALWDLDQRKPKVHLPRLRLATKPDPLLGPVRQDLHPQRDGPALPVPRPSARREDQARRSTG